MVCHGPENGQCDATGRQNVINPRNGPPGGVSSIDRKTYLGFSSPVFVALDSQTSKSDVEKGGSVWSRLLRLADLALAFPRTPSECSWAAPE